MHTYIAKVHNNTFLASFSGQLASILTSTTAYTFATHKLIC